VASYILVELWIPFNNIESVASLALLELSVIMTSDDVTLVFGHDLNITWCLNKTSHVYSLTVQTNRSHVA